jgi:hypothetical protein
MATRDARQPGLRDRLLAELKRSPKKTVVLAGLVGLLAIVAGRELVRRVTPSSARAAARPSQPTASREPARKPGPAGAAAASPAPAPLPGGGDPVVDRDIFKPNVAYFAPLAQRAKPAPTAAPVDMEAARREAERRAVQAQAQALRLQSTVVGEASVAIVNGQLLRKGDWISGFQVVEITAHTCTVEKKGMRVTLEMSN